MIEPNSKFGRYEIRSLIGAGGMGEVYLARDPKIGRDVAIKVLPESFAENIERLHRFEQEAQAAGALNHPNILTIHHIDTDGSSPYIVSELLEGETLADRIDGSPLPQRKAIDYALQIAHGLAAAHEKGIVHRDLKPDNIFVTNDGRVKILDFGLAKLTESENVQPQTDVPTRRVNTEPGAVMGTIGYMSPEQVRGRRVDHRSDIFSFGAILYEMLSGKRAFHGESTADTMSAILREDPPDLSATNKNIAPAFERVINHCLEKNPEERFHSANDLAFAIEALSGTTSVSGAAMIADIPSRPFRTREIIAWTLAFAFLVGSGALAYLYFRTPVAAARSLSFVVSSPEKATDIEAPIISPDGNNIVFIAFIEGKRALYIRSLDSVAVKRLDGTDDAFYPFWSPDSRSIGFFAGGKLKKIEMTGGPAQSLCDAPGGLGGSWNKDGVIIFGMQGKGMHRVSAPGGEATLVMPVDRANKELDHSFPWFLPDGKHFLYWSWVGDESTSQTCIGSLDGGPRKCLLKNDSNAEYTDAGYVVFARDSTLLAQHFDAQKLEVDGEAFPLMENVTFSANLDYSNFSIAQNGTLVFWSGGNLNRQLAWFDRSGKQIAPIGSPGEYNDIVLSPDGKRAATQRLDGANSDIWIMDIDRGLPVRFTFAASSEDNPSWSQDGKFLYYTSTQDGNTSIFRKLSGGGGTEEVLLNDLRGVDNGTEVSPDGKNLLFHVTSDKTGEDVWNLPLNGDGKAYPLLNSPFDEDFPHFSPDSHWFAYVSNESGRPEVYVQSFPLSGSKFQISNGGGGQPHWRRDGKELYFIAPDRKLMAVEIIAGANFQTGEQHSLFSTEVSSFMSPNRYDVSADGQKFILNSTAQETSQTPITVITNWTSTIKR